MSSTDQWTTPADSSTVDATPEFANASFQTFKVRALARIIDQVTLWFTGFVAGVVVAIAMIAFGQEIQVAEGNGFDWVGTLSGLLVLILSAATAELIGGATPGKLLVGIRTVSEMGERVNPISALLRNAMYFIDSLFFGLVAYGSMNNSETQQRVGDKVGGTVVVDAASAPYSMAVSAAGAAMFLVIATSLHCVMLALQFSGRL